MGIKKGHKMTPEQFAKRTGPRVPKNKVELEYTETTNLNKAQWIEALLADRAAAEASTAK